MTIAPDLIILDDIVTDENALTEDQRNKLVDLVLGAVKGSLASAEEFPNAKMALLQTPIHPDDVSGMALKDPQFVTVIAPCWTDATYDLPIDKQMSAWESMYPSETLRADKRAAIHRNKLSVFAREMECKLMRVENAAFLLPWLRTIKEFPRGGLKVLAIDPVPPPSDVQIKKNLIGKDNEAHVIVGRQKGIVTIHEYVQEKGHEPTWSVANALEMAHRHKVSRIVVESVGYQRVLKGMLEAEMRRRKMFFPVIPYTDSRSKYVRITNAIAGIASQGLLQVHEDMVEFISMFEMYPGVDHDDLLDAAAIGISEIMNPVYDPGDDPYDHDDEDGRPINVARSAP